MQSQNLQDLRTSYERGELLEAHVAPTPLAQFSQWLEHALASTTPEPNAMTLSTVGLDSQGQLRPTSRVVLIKGVDDRGLTWFTNYTSRKGLELAHTPNACLQFFWVDLQRQVRLEGAVEKLTDAENDAYFHTRPLGSRIGAWASPQSQVIADRQELLLREAQAAQDKGSQPARPPHWGGYRLVPDYVEFWQGRPNRLHDRLRYRLVAGQWVLERLAP